MMPSYAPGCCRALSLFGSAVRCHIASRGGPNSDGCILEAVRYFIWILLDSPHRYVAQSLIAGCEEGFWFGAFLRAECPGYAREVFQFPLCVTADAHPFGQGLFLRSGPIRFRRRELGGVFIFRVFRVDLLGFQLLDGQGGAVGMFTRLLYDLREVRVVAPDRCPFLSNLIESIEKAVRSYPSDPLG